MSVEIRILIEDLVLDAEFYETPCAKAVTALLPLEASPNVWGDEFYFTVPLAMPLDETATVAVKVGDIGYWPPGKALAIFFGPTPVSTGTDPVPASEVNLIGKIVGDASLLRHHKKAQHIRIE